MSIRPPRAPVKGTRAYDSSGRRERARRQHQQALEAARALFLEHGYVATTVESIAAAAGVSAATVYKSYGGKAGLARELVRRGLEGAGPVPAEERSNALRHSGSREEVVEGWSRFVAELAPRTAPLFLLLRDAARTDAEAADLYAEVDEARLKRMADNARFLADAGYLRDGVSVREARDVLWFVTTAETYDLLVTQRGWSLSKLSRFVRGVMTESLF